MRNKLGNICMFFGGALLLAALSLFLWNSHESAEAEIAATRVLSQVIGQIETAHKDVLPDPYDPTMTEVEIDGYTYIGYLSIPSIELELPVMSTWDYDRLRIAACRYSGSVKTDDMVIAAHNYTRHFGALSGLSDGDRVCFTDMNGVSYVYEVATIEVLAPDAVEAMTAGDYDLTLFTCNYSGAARFTVRCDRVTE